MSTPSVTPDLDREQRIGFAEVIYCPGKTDEQLRSAAEALFGRHKNVIASRATPEQAELLREIEPAVEYNSTARTAFLRRDDSNRGRGTVVVVSAGTTDIPVAEEAACTAEVMGNTVERIFDVGVAGLHRVMAVRERLESADRKSVV